MHPVTGEMKLLTLTGTAPPFLDFSFGKFGIDWASELGKLVLWNNTTNTATITTLTPVGDGSATWQFGTLPLNTANAATPPGAAEQGTFGRFGYSNSLRGLYLLNSSSQPVYFFALG